MCSTDILLLMIYVETFIEEHFKVFCDEKEETNFYKRGMLYFQ
jgi:hypothetical protein